MKDAIEQSEVEIIRLHSISEFALPFSKHLYYVRRRLGLDTDSPHVQWQMWEDSKIVALSTI